MQSQTARVGADRRASGPLYLDFRLIREAFQPPKSLRNSSLGLLVLVPLLQLLLTSGLKSVSSTQALAVEFSVFRSTVFLLKIVALETLSADQ